MSFELLSLEEFGSPRGPAPSDYSSRRIVSKSRLVSATESGVFLDRPRAIAVSSQQRPPPPPSPFARRLTGDGDHQPRRRAFFCRRCCCGSRQNHEISP